MKKFRNVEITVKAENVPPHMVGNGFRVRQYVPGNLNLKERFSPFLLLDYNEPFNFPPTQSMRGVGAHPHKGFETVTINIQGKIEHGDNLGNHGILSPGEVQWMTAGRGILHKEYHETEFAKQGGILHMIQLWVNLPRKYKNVEPNYQTLSKESMGRVSLENAEIKVISGEFSGVKGPARTYTPINIYSVDFKNDEALEINEPDNYNFGLLVSKGSVQINGKMYNENDFVIFENGEGTVELKAAAENTQVVVLSGEPINEPVVFQGPFVMNTHEEIMQAYEDFRNGKFGDADF